MRRLALCLLLASSLVCAGEPVHEYKFLLHAETDPVAQLEALAGRLRSDLPAQGWALTGPFRPRQARVIRFLDTPGTCQLYAAGWILRTREEGGRRELTLKLRGEVLAPPADGARGRLVFKHEVDVSPPARSSPGLSWSMKDARQVPDSLAQAKEMFPVLQLQDSGAVLQPVGGLEIREQVYELLRLMYHGRAFPLEAALWSDPAGAVLALELSFRFDEQPAGQAAALRLLTDVQAMAGGPAPEPSKTAVVYQVAKDFCLHSAGYHSAIH